MEAATNLSLHQASALHWMMRENAEEGNYLGAIRYADALLRTRPHLTRDLMPLLGALAEHEGARVKLAELLAVNPIWRRQFFAHLTSNVSDARAPLKVLLDLKNTPNPPTSEELAPYLQSLINKGFYDVAYYTWLQFLPADEFGKVGRLYNGDFESPSSELPFDWKFTAGGGVTIDVVARLDIDGDHALRLSFGGGRVSSLGVDQVILLPPGGYRVVGKHDAEITSQRGLHWSITCLGKEKQENAVLGESSPVTQASGGGWQDFSFSFPVPEEGCPAQRLQLLFDARSASEQFISGSVWYDELKIERDEVNTL